MVNFGQAMSLQTATASSFVLEKRIKRINSIVQKCLWKARTCMLKEHITRVQFGPLKRGFPFKRPGVFLKSSWVYCHVAWARFTSRSGTEGRWIHRLETDWREHWTGGGVGHKLVQCTLEKWWPLSFVTPRLQLEVSWQQVHQGIMAVTLMVSEFHERLKWKLNITSRYSTCNVFTALFPSMLTVIVNEL